MSPSLRLSGYDYAAPGAYFVTLCTDYRKPLFGNIINGEMALNDAGKIVENIWNALPQRFPIIILDAFVIMPNHVHGIIWIRDHAIRAIRELPLRNERRKMTIPMVIGFFKMNAAKRIHAISSSLGPIWQRNYYEHIIRNDASLNQIRQYVGENPLHWESDPEYNP